MGDATTHQNIEMEAWGVAKPNLLELKKVNGHHKFKRDFKDLTEEQKQALHVYCGNWMRDFSQLFVPVVLESAAKFPRLIKAAEVAKVTESVVAEEKKEEPYATIGPE